MFDHHICLLDHSMIWWQSEIWPYCPISCFSHNANLNTHVLQLKNLKPSMSSVFRSETDILATAKYVGHPSATEYTQPIGQGYPWLHLVDQSVHINSRHLVTGSLVPRESWAKTIWKCSTTMDSYGGNLRSIEITLWTWHTQDHSATSLTCAWSQSQVE